MPRGHDATAKGQKLKRGMSLFSSGETKRNSLIKKGTLELESVDTAAKGFFKESEARGLTNIGTSNWPTINFLAQCL